jgi:hypothetical protein
VSLARASSSVRAGHLRRASREQATSPPGYGAGARDLAARAGWALPCRRGRAGIHGTGDLASGAWQVSMVSH